MNSLSFSIISNRSYWYHFWQVFGGAGRVMSDFVKCCGEFIRQKSRFSQFWTFTPIISTLLVHLKISIMPPKNDWKIDRMTESSLKGILWQFYKLGLKVPSGRDKNDGIGHFAELSSSWPGEAK